MNRSVVLSTVENQPLFLSPLLRFRRSWLVEWLEFWGPPRPRHRSGSLPALEQLGTSFAFPRCSFPSSRYCKDIQHVISITRYKSLISNFALPTYLRTHLAKKNQVQFNRRFCFYPMSWHWPCRSSSKAWSSATISCLIESINSVLPSTPLSTAISPCPSFPLVRNEGAARHVIA